jgi:nicotinamide phosphoribosyltransferase
MRDHDNIILDTDSYKLSHFRQYPPRTDALFAYLEARGGRFAQTVFFGLQPILERLATRITDDDIREAGALAKAHGLPFPETGWRRVLTEHGGKIPLLIRAVPEGSIVPVRNALLTAVSTDPQLPWMTTWFETQIMRVWYPITVATKSYYCKKVIWDALKKTSNDPASEIPFKLHDFGSRGVSSFESAGIGGAAHLVNFQGTDTLAALGHIHRHYRTDWESGEVERLPMPGFSIPAMEHSTVTAWGRKGEAAAFANMIRQHGEFPILACVSDSYDIEACVETLWADELLDLVKTSGKTIVIRPDSGEPEEVLPRLLDILDRKVGCTVNMKGYKLLPSYFRFIWGDGNKDETSIQRVLDAVIARGYSASNVAFGMGGGLLQLVDRDTCQFAYKTSAARINGAWVDVKKEPKTDVHKVSKAGRLDLVQKFEGGFETGQYSTIALTVDPEKDSITDPPAHRGSALVEVFRNGEVKKRWSFAEVRERAGRMFG